ncbi:hypothetical protein [[Clostridium] dakarense]|nr:hypothetical protein [[Clostridium] dakarense]
MYKTINIIDKEQYDISIVVSIDLIERATHLYQIIGQNKSVKTLK